MIARLRILAARTGYGWAFWTGFKAGWFVGVVTGFLIMAPLMVAVFTAPDALAILLRKAMP